MSVETLWMVRRPDGTLIESTPRPNIYHAVIDAESCAARLRLILYDYRSSLTHDRNGRSATRGAEAAGYRIVRVTVDP